MTWREQLGKDNRGSRPRCVLLVDGDGKEVADRLTQLVGRQDEVIIDHSDRWMPYGKPARKAGSWDNAPAKEAQLDELAHLLPRNIKRQQEIKEQLRCWWLAANGRANTPHWDIASTCTIKGKPGLLLIEAKAHVNELSPRGKTPPKASASDDSQKNHERIDRAIKEAAIGLQSATGKDWNISRDTHYQLSNRFAWSWKLVSLCIPVVLVYLGFLNAQDMTGKELFRSCDHWEKALMDYSKDVIDNTCWGKWLEFDGVPLLPLIRACNQSLKPCKINHMS